MWKQLPWRTHSVRTQRQGALLTAVWRVSSLIRDTEATLSSSLYQERAEHAMLSEKGEDAVHICKQNCIISRLPVSG